MKPGRRLLPIIICAALAASRLLAQGDSGLKSPTGVESFVLPEKDSQLQWELQALLLRPPFRALVANKGLSLALVDLSGEEMRFAGVAEDVMRYAASLPKIAVMLAVFDRVEKGDLVYTPKLRGQLEKMIRRSSNREASRLIRLVGFESIAEVLLRPEYELYDSGRHGGLWVGKGYGDSLGRWKRDPIENISHGATARQVARFLVLVERGELISPWASAEMKRTLGKPAIQHKFVKGLSSRPGTRIYRKSGTWRKWHCDAAIVEHDGKTYVAVALLESSTKGVLARLITDLDDLIVRPRAQHTTDSSFRNPPAEQRQ